MMNHCSISDALFTKSQQRVLSLLYGKPDQSYYLNEIVRLAGMGKGTIKRELEKMSAAGLLTITRQGNQNHYQANTDNPVFSELRSIAKKTFGIMEIVKTALAPILPTVEMAFIYGSVAKGTEHAGSDIDVMLVADDLSYSETLELLEPAEKKLGRTVNPSLYAVNEFSDRVSTNQNFIKKVMGQPKIWLKGENGQWSNTIDRENNGSIG